MSPPSDRPETRRRYWKARLAPRWTWCGSTIYGLLIATLIMLPAGVLIGRYAYKSIITFPKALLVPMVAFLTVIGSFAIHSNPHETQVMFGVYKKNKHSFPQSRKVSKTLKWCSMAPWNTV